MSEDPTSPDDADVRRARRTHPWIDGGIALGVLGALYVGVTAFRSVSTSPQHDARAIVRAASSPAPISRPTPRILVTAPVSPSAVVNAPSTSASGIEVCGFGVSPSDEAGMKVYEREEEAAAQRARQRVHAALLASGRTEARAVGRLLAIQDAAEPASRSDPEDRCGEDAACLEKERAEHRLAIERSTRVPRDALVQMALDTGNPLAYGLAVEACGTANDEPSTREGKCQLITLDEWSRLDPADMSPWLARANVAARAGDQAALDEAFHRASLAETFHRPSGAMVGIAEGEMASGYEPFERLSAQIELFGIAMASPLLSMREYSTYCSAAAVHDANRYQVCDRLTAALLAHGATMLDRRIALAVAEKRLEWPMAKTAPLRLESDMLSERNARMPFNEKTFGCANIERFLRKSARMSRLGELPAMRLEMAEAGESPEQALAANRDWRESQRHRLSAEAAAASAAALAASTPYSATPLPAR